MKNDPRRSLRYEDFYEGERETDRQTVTDRQSEKGKDWQTDSQRKER